MISLLNHHRSKNNIIFISTLIIILFIIAFFGIPFTHWWFTGDDFHGIFLGYKTKTWSDLFYFFCDGHTNQGVGNPGGYVLSKPDFLGAYYRPLYCIYLAIQFWLFGTNGYGYFLCNITAHALAAGLLFYLIAQHASQWTASLAGLLFAFHPQIAYRFGAVVNFHYYVNVVLVLCIALALQSYLKKNSYFTLCTALGCYALSLLTRETTIVLPVIIGILLLANAYSNNKKPNWLFIIKLCCAFGFIGLGFIGLRLWLYPLKQIAANGTFLPYAAKGSFIAIKFQEFLVFFYDLLFVSWLPWGNKSLKVIILAPLLSLLGYTFFLCRQKFLVCCFFICGILILWPGLISFYSPRYIYESMPFFLAGFATLFITSQLNQNLKLLLKIATSGFTAVLIFFTFTSFQAREKKLHTMHQALEKLCSHLEVAQRHLCFLTTPSDGSPGPQLFWILFNNRVKNIYFDAALILTQQDSNIVKPGKWFNAIAQYYNRNYVTIKPIDQGFEFCWLDTKKIIFEATDADRNQKLGSIKILDQQITDTVRSLQLNISPDIWNQKPLFISWNYEKKQFDVFDYFNETRIQY
jgi:hypothetical protein